MTKTALSSLLLLSLAPVGAAQWTECHKLLPNDGLAGDTFGSAVATDGALVAVGAPWADDLGANSGAAYVLDPTTGLQLLDLLPNDGATGDHFGASVAVGGSRVLVGAPLADAAGQDSGAVYVFDAGTGAQVAKLTPNDAAPDAQFGFAVAVDGALAVVGGVDSAYVFDLATGQQVVKLVPSVAGGGFGEAVDIDGGRALVGARLQDGVSGFAGAAFLFDATTGAELHRLIADNGVVWAFFGAAVSLEGDVVAIGAPEAYGGVGKHAGVAYVFDAVTGAQVHYLWPNPSEGGHIFARFGSSVALDGPDLFIGARLSHALPVVSAGAVFLYDPQSGAQVTKLVASDAASGDHFGAEAAAAGGVLVVGAPRGDDLGDTSGSAYVFDAQGCGGLGAAYCDSNPNSSGATAALTAVGSPSIAQNDVTFDVAALPTNQFGYLLMSDTQGFVPLFGGSQGNLCLGGQIVRFDGDVLNSGATGSVSFSPDLTDLPQNTVFSPGETWSFQYWTRDANPTPTSNTSNGLEIQFL